MGKIGLLRCFSSNIKWFELKGFIDWSRNDHQMVAICKRNVPNRIHVPHFVFLITNTGCSLKGFATFWEFSLYGQKKVADYEYNSLFAEKIHFHT